MWRFVVGLLCMWLWAWVALTPAHAHHPVDSDLVGSDLVAHHLADSGLVHSTGIDSVSSTDATVVLPPNFVLRNVVSGLTLPTDMVVLPTGDLLITEKGLGAGVVSEANIRFVRGGVLQPAPVLTLSVNSEEDSGLMGIVLDPEFEANGYFYVWYSTGEDALGWDGTSYNRLSRFFFDEAAGKAELSSETIILDRVTWAAIHNGGGLIFDDAGNLLITTGDAGANQFSPQVNLAQQLTSLNGKVLRIRPLPEGGYAIPDDNPYVGNVEGIRPEIYAYGLRNPFRIAQRMADRRFYLIDVGHDTWEEVNLLEAGANYGWPIREGKCPFAQMNNCQNTPEEFTDPVVTYLHPPNEGAGFTALVFYEGTQWPQQFRDRLLVADFNADRVGMVNIELVDPPFATFATELDAVVDLEATAEGLYALSIVDGSVKAIYYDAESNNPPTARWQVTPNSGSGPLQVTFLATAADIENDALAYVWDFGDSIRITTTSPTINHVYEVDGDYLATLQVVDVAGGKSEILSQLIQVYSGAQPRIIRENLTSVGRTLYWGGDKFRFHVARDGGDEGLDPEAPYAWTILLHHNEHAHYLLAGYVSEEVELEIPTKTHALNSPLWYEVRLTMLTASGQRIVKRMDLRPQTTTMQVQSWPGPTNILIDQQAQLPDSQTVVIVGQEYTLEAPQKLIHQGQVGEFKNWVVTPSWPQASAVEAAVIVAERVYTLTAPLEANSYVAFYEYSGQATTNYLPDISK